MIAHAFGKALSVHRVLYKHKWTSSSYAEAKARAVDVHRVLWKHKWTSRGDAYAFGKSLHRSWTHQIANSLVCGRESNFLWNFCIVHGPENVRFLVGFAKEFCEKGHVVAKPSKGKQRLTRTRFSVYLKGRCTQGGYEAIYDGAGPERTKGYRGRTF